MDDHQAIAETSRVEAVIETPDEEFAGADTASSDNFSDDSLEEDGTYISADISATSNFIIIRFLYYYQLLIGVCDSRKILRHKTLRLEFIREELVSWERNDRLKTHILQACFVCDHVLKLGDDARHEQEAYFGFLEFTFEQWYDCLKRTDIHALKDRVFFFGPGNPFKDLKLNHLQPLAKSLYDFLKLCYERDE